MKTKHYLQRYIAQKVKYLRKKQNMSQEELSERADLGLKYINQLENQNVNLTIHSLEKVISALELSLKNSSILIHSKRLQILLTAFHLRE